MAEVSAATMRFWYSISVAVEPERGATSTATAGHIMLSSGATAAFAETTEIPAEASADPNEEASLRLSATELACADSHGMGSEFAELSSGAEGRLEV